MKGPTELAVLGLAVELLHSDRHNSEILQKVFSTQSINENRDVKSNGSTI